MREKAWRTAESRPGIGRDSISVIAAWTMSATSAWTCSPTSSSHSPRCCRWRRRRSIGSFDFQSSTSSSDRYFVGSSAVVWGP